MGPPAASPPRLIRALGPMIAIAIVVGTMVGSGVFKKPQVVAANVPNFWAAALVWILGGVLAILGALAYAEVAVLFPRAGGNYVFLREGYGRLAGFLWGWVNFGMILGGSLAALATVFTESLHDILRDPNFQTAVGMKLGADPLGFWPQKVVTVFLLLGLAAINVRGVKWGGGLQLFITLIKIGSLLAFLLLGCLVVASIWPNNNPAPAILDQQVAPTLSPNGILTSLLAVMFAYHGWMNITPVAEEVKDPQRNIPLALLGGTGIVIFLYLGANWAYYNTMSREEMAQMKQLSPQGLEEFQRDHPGTELPDKTVGVGFCRRLLGPIGAAIAAAMIMCSAFGALNGNMLTGPRLLYAMGEDGLAPRALGAVHPQFRTPSVAIMVLAIWVSLLVVGVAILTQLNVLPNDKPHFDILSDYAMFGSTTFETLALTTIFVFRIRLPDAPRAYRCWGYPFVPAIYVFILAMVVTNMFASQTREALIGVGFIGVGALIYLFIPKGTAPPFEVPAEPQPVLPAH